MKVSVAFGLLWAASLAAQPLPLAVVAFPPGSVGHQLAQRPPAPAPATMPATTWNGYVAAVGMMPEPARATWLQMPAEMVPSLVGQAREQSRLERQLMAQRVEQRRLVTGIERSIARIEEKARRMP